MRELDENQKKELGPVLNAMETHFIDARKVLVDRLQSIEQQQVEFANNPLVIESLAILEERVKNQLARATSIYERCQYSLEQYCLDLLGALAGEYYY